MSNKVVINSTLRPGSYVADGRFYLMRKIGAGSHGDVFLSKDTTTDEEIAVKLESWDTPMMCLQHESNVYKILEGGIGFPTARYFGQESRHNVLVIDMLGSSLEELFSKCGFRFSLKTVLMIADQLMDRIQYLHSKNFIHRSIKPENFVIGRNGLYSTIYMIDFGNAKCYRNPHSGKHIAFKEYRELGLNACHSKHQSIGALCRMERSRRDDLESLGYMLTYFIRGKLPWEEITDPAELKNRKLTISLDELCEGCPEEFAKYLAYCRTLGFEEDPDYEYLRQLFRTVSNRLGFKYDYQFDWVALQPVEKREANNNTLTTTTATATAKFMFNQKLLSEQNFLPSPVAVAVDGDIHQR
ncbi:unnamed protein product [Orchesella dallaii]|uniref:Protein kinase domain-containing protein n=1 Tax=Orchesella dallaii TaxID=48710 RepID=A0ABP1QY70_9HEXA